MKAVIVGALEKEDNMQQNIEHTQNEYGLRLLWQVESH